MPDDLTDSIVAFFEPLLVRIKDINVPIYRDRVKNGCDYNKE